MTDKAKNNLRNYKIIIQNYFSKMLFHFFRVPLWIRSLFIALLSFILLFIALNFLFPLPNTNDYSQIVKSAEGDILYATLNSTDKWRFKTNLEEITPILKKTILHKEDKYFYYHFGINPISMGKAFIQNLFNRDKRIGASTISMQIARMLEPKKRTYFNKIIEIFRALQLEFTYSKDEILQLYINLVPYGGNIEGVKTAAYFYFHQKPEALSLAQITLLSIIPNFPNIIHSKDESELYIKRNNWLHHFKRTEIFNEKVVNDALREIIQIERRPRPMMAPHVAIRACQENKQSSEIETTIQIEIQKKVSQITKNYIQAFKYSNISNASVLIINNKTNEIVAYIGSSDFFDSANQGQVDGIRAIRSPGSTLKPLLYAQAIDLGLITPKTKMVDVPINYGGYYPGNYDNKCRGLVTTEQALAQSLNIPAVWLLNEVGKDAFVRLLIKANFKQIAKDQDKLGLSTILGGCGVNLEELTNLFSAFANKGILQKASLYPNAKNRTIPIVSSASAYMISEILTKAERPDFPSNWSHNTNAPKIAWKTGTSYGRRDAWSIGYNINYTVGVWAGNFDGTGTPELTGANVATPLLFQIFNTIDQHSDKFWFAPPKTIDYREVCSESGLIPDEFCTHLIIDSYIPGISPNQRCQHMKEVFVDIKETKSYCRACKPDKNIIRKLYRNLPMEVIAFYEEQNIPYQKIPPHNESCTRIFSQNAPIITSLGDGLEYILISGENQKIMLKANTENSVKKLWWYLNDKLLCTTKAKENFFFKPPEGNLKISCTDDKGRNTDIWIIVKYI